MLMVNHLVGFGGGGALAWVPTFGPITFNTNAGSWAGITVRQLIPASSLSTSGSFVRVKFEAPTNSSFVVAAAYIGPQLGAGYDMAATPAELRFSGVSGFSIASSAVIVSDETPFALDETAGHIVSYDVTSGNARYVASALDVYFKAAAAEAGVANVTGYSPAAGRTQAVSTIEIGR
jgi:hypothetical protein